MTTMTTLLSLAPAAGLSLFLTLRARRKIRQETRSSLPSPAVDHIVFFRLGGVRSASGVASSAASGAASGAASSAASSAASRTAELQLLAALRALSDLPCVLDISLGQRFNDASRSHGYTHGIVVRLVNAQALPVYANHPQHLAVLKLVQAALDGSAAGSAAATSDGATADGAAADGATTDGATTDGATTDGATADGAVPLLPPPVLALDIAAPRILGTAGGESKTAAASNSNNTPRSVSHVVPICLRPSCHPGCASCKQLDRDLAAGAADMARGIPGIVDVTFGRSFTTARARGFTHVLNVRFVDKAAGDAYQPHRLHAAFKKILRGNLSPASGCTGPVACLDWESLRA